MPQLDPLIWLNLCYNNTLFFWVIYFIIIRIILVKSNVMFYFRLALKNKTYFNNYLKINKQFLMNFFIFKEFILKNTIFIKNRFLIFIFNNYLIRKENINYRIITFILSSNKNKNLFNTYIYNKFLYIITLKKIK